LFLPLLSLKTTSSLHRGPEGLGLRVVLGEPKFFLPYEGFQLCCAFMDAGIVSVFSLFPSPKCGIETPFYVCRPWPPSLPPVSGILEGATFSPLRMPSPFPRTAGDCTTYLQSLPPRFGQQGHPFFLLTRIASLRRNPRRSVLFRLPVCPWLMFFACFILYPK